MLDVYSLREGEFEIVDLDITDERLKKIRIYNLIRFGLILTGVFFIFAILFILGSKYTYAWTILFLPLLLGVVLVPALLRINEQIPMQISGILLGFDHEKRIERLRVQKWREKSANEYIEENVRFNQAIGFRAIWRDNGEILVEIIVEPNYPGNPVFNTLTFHTLAELIVTLQLCMPNHDKWFYQLEDHTDWPPEAKAEINEEVLTARAPWQIRDYFDSL